MRNTFYLVLFFFAIAMWSCGDGSSEPTSPPEKEVAPTLFPLTSFAGKAQGTTYSIKYINDSLVYKEGVDSLLLQFDKDLSTWRDGSLINQINDWNRTDRTFSFIDSTKNFSVVFDLSREVYLKTNGAFDPTVFPLVELWGFGKKSVSEVSEDSVAATLQYVGMEPAKVDMLELNRDTYIYDHTEIRKGYPEVKLDFNAIAQGYSIDLIADYLESNGVQDYMIELGGEVLCKGINQDGRAWRIAIDKPKSLTEQREFQALLDVENKAVATSGSYRKFKEVNGKRVSHAIDPRTGYPVDHNLLSATVLAKSCGIADAYATAFLVMGPEASLSFLDEHPELGLEVYFILSEGDQFQVLMSESLKEKIIEL
ncbi:MAG: FAD:protein FMN transferase [Flavobacteriales bacterium]|nr:FAD:protein FMN transferase [Flavobacteriales bacterium]